MMQFHRGDASQCLGAADGTYFADDVGMRVHRIATKNYTFEIPTDGRLVTNNTGRMEGKVITDLIRQHAPCKINQDFNKFPYIIRSDTILISSIREGQLLQLTAVRGILPPHFEFAINVEAGYKVCYPSNVIADYIETKLLK